MIVSLPMYDWPETHDYHNYFWQRLQPALEAFCPSTPEQLSRSDEQHQWQRNDVLLSQTCAYPLITSLPESTIVIGTPEYDCDYCESGQYASAVLVRQSDDRQTLAEFANSTLAFNNTDSQSGYNALKSLLVEKQFIDNQKPVFFGASVCTQSHRSSIQAVVNKTADICAIDPVSWALAKRFDNQAQNLRVLLCTASSPALPLICSAQTIPANQSTHHWCAMIREAFERAIDPYVRQHLLLSGIRFIPKSQYQALHISHLKMV